MAAPKVMCGNPSVPDPDFEGAVKFFNANREGLVEDFENAFIAIIDNKVIDFGEDFSELAERVYKKYGYRSIHMPKVTREPEVAHVPTPFTKVVT